MKLTDILSAAPGGRAQLRVAGYPATILLPSHMRDHHPMPWLQKKLVGSMTPGMTWRNGMAINEWLLQLQAPRDIVKNLVHENMHWWQLWRRMGPTDFPATYGWQGLIRLFKSGSAHLHDVHPMETEAQRAAAAILALIEAMPRATPQSIVTFDMLPWLEQHYPASRS